MAGATTSYLIERCFNSSADGRVQSQLYIFKGAGLRIRDLSYTTMLLVVPIVVVAQDWIGGSDGSIFETRPSRRQPPLPGYQESAPQLELDVPRVEEPQLSGDLPYAIRTYVSEFRISGNTAVSTEELKQVVAPFEGREITNNELEEVRQRLTLYYVDRGYLNSGAVIPDQKVIGGVVEVQVIEGTLTRILIEGVTRFDPEYFTSRLALRSGPPLNVNDLQEQLQILIQNDLVRGIRAELGPGDSPGTAVLKATVAEAPPYAFGLVVDNKLPPSLGEFRLLAQGEARNLAGWGDVLAAELGLSEGIKADFKASYSAPLSPRDLTLGIYFEDGNAEVVEEPFDELDIETELRTYGVSLDLPPRRTANERLGLGLSLERTRTDTTLLGEPFSFSPGVEDGKAVVSVLRFVQDWTRRSQNQVISARSTISFGLDAFGSTVNGNLPDSRFVTWIPQFQWARRFGDWGHQVFFRFDGQLSSDSLLPIERFTVGGLDSVRGYRSNQLVRDEGYVAALQYQLPLFRDPIGTRNLQLAAFVDTGFSRENAGDQPDPSHLTGVGMGLIWEPDLRFRAELYVAHALDDVQAGGENSLQDESVYFRLVARTF